MGAVVVAMNATTAVLRAWVAGKPATNARRTLATDGQRLYSYRVAIGNTLPLSGARIVYSYRAPSGAYLSQTTSRHVTMAACYADEVLVPSPGLLRRARAQLAAERRTESTYGNRPTVPDPQTGLFGEYE